MHRLTPALVALLVAAGGAGTAVSDAGAQAGGSSGAGRAGPGTTVTAGPGSPQPAGPPTGDAAQQTHPVIDPRHPTRRSHVSLRFTLSDAPGHHGVVETGYRVQVAQPAGSRAACAAAAPSNITNGDQGARVTVALPPPRHGWCRGEYAATVFLQRGPYCPAPQPGQPPQPCPEFASQDLQVGRIAFLVRALTSSACSPSGPRRSRAASTRSGRAMARRASRPSRARSSSSRSICSNAAVG